MGTSHGTAADGSGPSDGEATAMNPPTPTTVAATPRHSRRPSGRRAFLADRNRANTTEQAMTGSTSTSRPLPMAMASKAKPLTPTAIPRSQVRRRSRRSTSRGSMAA